MHLDTKKKKIDKDHTKRGKCDSTDSAKDTDRDRALSNKCSQRFRKV